MNKSVHHPQAFFISTPPASNRHRMMSLLDEKLLLNIIILAFFVNHLLPLKQCAIILSVFASLFIAGLVFVFYMHFMYLVLIPPPSLVRSLSGSCIIFFPINLKTKIYILVSYFYFFCFYYFHFWSCLE